jgi:ABC-2 type transport system permease protein
VAPLAFTANEIWTVQQMEIAVKTYICYHLTKKGVTRMDIIKLSTDWAKAEAFSAKIVWLFSVVELLAAIGFWYWGRTTIAKTFTWPLLVMGLFLIAVGAGLYAANHPRIAQFENDYRREPKAFLEAEIQRTSKSQRELALVFKILPAIIIFAAVVIMLAPASIWRPIAVALILNAAFLMVVDSNTDARNDAYHSQLLAFKP